MWVAKTKASLKHFAVTLTIICLTAYLVFFIWYPGVYSRVMPGAQLFIIIACVELILGPCMTLVVFNPQKPFKELLRDYSVVIGIQLVALSYGIFSVSQVRPAYTVLNGGQLQVVSASEIESKHMAETGEFSFLPFWGPILVCLRAPVDSVEKAEALEMSGKGIPQYEVPKYFKMCKKGQLNSSAKSMSEFRKIAADSKDNEMLNNLSKIVNIDQKYVWIPIKSRFSTSVAFVNINTERLEYIVDANKRLY